MIPYYLISSARAGSTALARLLDLSPSGTCAIEPSPNLDREGRLYMDGLLDRETALEEMKSRVVSRVREGMKQHGSYGEKNVTYGPFLQDLYNEEECRFVLLHRDGREVVTSMMNWHTGKFGNIYREACSSEAISSEATSAAANLLACDDMSDFARPRPALGSRLSEEWPTMSREAMCAWYWSNINSLYLQQLEHLPATHHQSVRLGDGLEALKGVFQFLELTTPGDEELQELMNARINSLKDRDASTPIEFPAWTSWDSGMRDMFERHAGNSMEELGYWSDHQTRWRPDDYGACWQDRDDIEEWYAWMYDSRRPMHEQLLGFISERAQLQTIVDIGCGIGEGYSTALADRQYIGVDLSKANIEWCNSNRTNERHQYIESDFLLEDPDAPADLVFSQGTIDNTWDVDEYLEAMVRWSKGLIYVTCYRGWFPELAEHRYTWNPEHGCFYNDISPSRVRRVLQDLGCWDILIEPVEGRDLPCRETRIIARVPGDNTGGGA